MIPFRAIKTGWTEAPRISLIQCCVLDWAISQAAFPIWAGVVVRNSPNLSIHVSRAFNGLRRLTRTAAIGSRYIGTSGMPVLPRVRPASQPVQYTGSFEMQAVPWCRIVGDIVHICIRHEHDKDGG